MLCRLRAAQIPVKRHSTNTENVAQLSPITKHIALHPSRYALALAKLEVSPARNAGYISYPIPCVFYVLTEVHDASWVSALCVYCQNKDITPA